MNIETELQAIDRDTLNPLVQKALDSETATVTDWQVAPLPAERRNVFRFTGHACTAGKTAAWSLVLKVVRRERTSGRREAQANASGLLRNLSGGLAAARCFGVEAHGDTFRIWQEEVVDEIGQPWPLDRYSLAARHLGQFNGAYLAVRPPPHRAVGATRVDPWLGYGRRSTRRRTTATSPGPPAGAPRVPWPERG